jgi:hypothetical protein
MLECAAQICKGLPLPWPIAAADGKLKVLNPQRGVPFLCRNKGDVLHQGRMHGINQRFERVSELGVADVVLSGGGFGGGWKLSASHVDAPEKKQSST